MDIDPTSLSLPPLSAAAQGPLYRQIVDGVKRELSAGRLRPGQSLPSFRALAEELLVSLITVKRAYDELEREGIIFRRQGLGTFVSPNGAARSREVKRRAAEQLMLQAVREAREAGLAEAEIQRLIDKTVRQQRKESAS
jgi:GntR family transcriptional regulator